MRLRLVSKIEPLPNRKFEEILSWNSLRNYDCVWTLIVQRPHALEARIGFCCNDRLPVFFTFSFERTNNGTGFKSSELHRSFLSHELSSWNATCFDRSKNPDIGSGDYFSAITMLLCVIIVTSSLHCEVTLSSTSEVLTGANNSSASCLFCEWKKKVYKKQCWCVFIRLVKSGVEKHRWICLVCDCKMRWHTMHSRLPSQKTTVHHDTHPHLLLRDEAAHALRRTSALVV